MAHTAIPMPPEPEQYDKHRPFTPLDIENQPGSRPPNHGVKNENTKNASISGTPGSKTPET